jgi:hypothetical protein
MHLFQKLSTVLAFLGARAFAQSPQALRPTGVLFPLYIYPGDNCVGWDSVISGYVEIFDSKSTQVHYIPRITSQSTIQFYIVVNPASGPGAPGSQPDANYQACTARLRTTGTAAGNVQILGYVSTQYANREQASVLADISTFSAWKSDYKPEGIFFDEVNATTDHLAQYQNFVSQARSQIGSGQVRSTPFLYAFFPC